MTAIPWSTVLTAAERAAKLLPPPFNVVADLALVIARGYLDAGCALDGCPSDVEALLAEARQPIPPEDEAMTAAASAARARVRGLDRASIRERRLGPIAVATGEARPGQSAFGDAWPRPDGARDLAEYEASFGIDDGDTADGEPPGAA